MQCNRDTRRRATLCHLRSVGEREILWHNIRYTDSFGSGITNVKETFYSIIVIFQVPQTLSKF